VKALYKWWNIPDDSVKTPFLILPHSYGITRDEKLPEASKLALNKAAAILKEHPQATILLVMSNIFWKPIEYELNLKLAYLRSISVDMTRVVSGGGIVSTVEEILRTKDLYGLDGREVVSICDHLHARRIRYLWRRLAPEVQAKIVSITGKWDKTATSWFLRSNFRWLLGNIIHLCIFMILGKKSVNITHSIAKK
jgi:hypothetical protein